MQVYVMNWKQSIIKQLDSLGSSKNSSRLIRDRVDFNLRTEVTRVALSLFFLSKSIRSVCRRRRSTLGMTNTFQARENDRKVLHATPSTCAENVLVASITLPIDKKDAINPLYIVKIYIDKNQARRNICIYSQIIFLTHKNV